MAATSNEKRQVLGQQHVLIEDNLAPCQKPARSVAPERILAPADQDIGLVFDAVAIDQEAAGDPNLFRPDKGSLGALPLHVLTALPPPTLRPSTRFHSTLIKAHPPPEEARRAGSKGGIHCHCCPSFETHRYAMLLRMRLFVIHHSMKAGPSLPLPASPAPRRSGGRAANS